MQDYKPCCRADDCDQVTAFINSLKPPAPVPPGEPEKPPVPPGAVPGNELPDKSSHVALWVTGGAVVVAAGVVGALVLLKPGSAKTESTATFSGR
jgi:hypothetical protein